MSRLTHRSVDLHRKRESSDRLFQSIPLHCHNTNARRNRGLTCEGMASVGLGEGERVAPGAACAVHRAFAAAGSPAGPQSAIRTHGVMLVGPKSAAGPAARRKCCWAVLRPSMLGAKPVFCKTVEICGSDKNSSRTLTNTSPVCCKLPSGLGLLIASVASPKVGWRSSFADAQVAACSLHS